MIVHSPAADLKYVHVIPATGLSFGLDFRDLVHDVEHIAVEAAVNFVIAHRGSGGSGDQN